VSAKLTAGDRNLQNPALSTTRLALFIAEKYYRIALKQGS